VKFFSQLIVAILLAITSATSSAQRANNEEEVTLNFVEAEIASVAKAISKISGRNFLIDPRVRGTISIVSGQPVPRSMAYQIMVSALRLQGFVVVESGGIAKVIPEADAKTHGGPVGKVPSGWRSGTVVTRVFRIRYEQAAQMVTVLRPLVSKNMAISAYSGSNTLVITDTADNVTRLARIIASIDVPTTGDPLVVHLQHTQAKDVVERLNRTFSGSGGVTGGGKQGGIAFVADVHSNLVVMRSNNMALVEQAKTLIAELDQPGAGFGNIHVIPVRNADAAELAQTLRSIMEDNSGSNVQQPQGSQRGSDGANGSFSDTRLPGLKSGSMIQADTSTNSLIIIAPPAVYKNLKRVVEMLDRRRSQVFLEVLVAELNAERAAEFGVQWQALGGLNKSGRTAIGGTNFGRGNVNILNISQQPGSVSQGLNLGIVKGTINVPGLGVISNLSALAHMLETDINANVLSTPNILTLDNEEAKIVIGQNIPFTTGSYTNSNNGAINPFQTYERQDVGLTLRVKPQITDGDVIRVQIYQEVSSVISGTLNNTAGPATYKRSLTSKVLVDDGGLIVLGGLLENRHTNDENKVPILGDLPLLGSLFRYQNQKNSKTNLMIFLRPTVIRNPSDYQRLANIQYDRMEHDQLQYGAYEQRHNLWTYKPPHLPSRGAPESNAPFSLPRQETPYDWPAEKKLPASEIAPPSGNQADAGTPPVWPTDEFGLIDPGQEFPAPVSLPDSL